ncbi:MAG: PqiC family protein [Gemmatimonadota bacterium]
MIHWPRTTRLLLLSALVTLGGCFSLARDPSPPRHYVLGGGGEAAASPAATARTSIGLRPPRLAEYLMTPFIVVRRDIHQIGFSEFDRWGEGVVHGIGRTVARSMSVRAPSLRVETTPWPTTAQPEYVIEMDVLRFEGVAPADSLAVEGEAHLLATWEITRRRDGSLLASGTTEVREPGWTVGDFHGLVALLDAALDRLGAELVLELEAALERVPPRD